MKRDYYLQAMGLTRNTAGLATIILCLFCQSESSGICTIVIIILLYNIITVSMCIIALIAVKTIIVLAAHSGL